MDRSLELDDLTSALDARFDRVGRGFGRILTAWTNAVGPKVSQHAMPTSLRDGTLRVRCADATWTSELLHMAPTIIRSLRAEMGDQAPHQLSTYTGRVHQPDPPPTPVVAPLPPIDDQTLIQLSQMVESIDDPELRARVLRAMVACTSRNRQFGVNTPNSRS